MSQLGQITSLLSSGVTSLTGDSGGALSGALKIKGGNNITTAAAGTDITVNVSGTTNHAIQLGNVGGSLSSLAVGATGTVLTGVTGADPAFSASPTVTTIYAGTFDTNVAAAGVTLSGTTLSADGTDVDININITAKGAGKVIIDDLQLTTDLAVTEGGTGASTLLDHGLLVGSGTAAVDALAVGATGTILTGVTGADPTWTTATYPSTVTKGDVLVASANNVVGVVNDVVNAGYVLTANAAAAPTFQALPAGVTFASDAETIAGAVTNKAVAPSNLAAKLGSQTLHALPIGAGSTAALNWLAVGANGETLMGSTGADCGWTNSPQFGGSVTATNDITSTAGSISSLSGSMISRDATNTSTGPSAYFQKVRVAATIQSGDELGKMRFTGYDGTGYITGAKITSTNSGTVATNRIAGDLQFYTHPDSVVALPSEPTLRMTIDSIGQVTIASPDSGTGLTVSGGGITCTSGAITATSGDLTLTDGDAIIGNRDAATTSPIAYFKKSRTGAVLTSGDLTGTIKFSGYDGTQYTDSAKITSTSSGTIASTRVAGDLKFYTHPDSAAADPTLRMTIAATGAVTIASPDSGVGLTVSGGGITCSSGAIAASSGAISASTTVTAGTNLVSTAGYLDLPKVSATKGYIKINNNVFIHQYDSGGFEESLYIGVGAGNFSTSQRYSCGVGTNALHAAAGGGGQNLAFGASCLSSLTSGAYNNAFGQTGGGSLLTGSYNLFLGGYLGSNYTGNLYTGSESSNIIIMNTGTVGDSNTMRIGTSGSGNGQVNRAFIAGIYGVTPGGTQNVALIDSNGQLGSTATLPPSLGGAMTWTEVTGTSQAAAVSNGYITNNVALVTVTLPSTAAVGQRVAITGKGAGLWKLAQNSGQTVHFGSTDTTTGATGYLAATVRYDCVEVQCITANTDWVVIRSQGTISVV